MDALKKFEELPMHDPSTIEEAKALIEKLNMMAQASSTPAVHELPSVEPITSENHDDDNASDFSGYSMLTPSAASKLERDDEKLPLDQQAHVEEQVDIDAEPHASELDVDRLVSEAVEHSMTIKQPQEKNTIVFPAEGEPASGKRKLVGIVITFEQAVDFDNGQHAVRFVGDHLGVSLGPQAKEIRVLSIEGDGHLEVSMPPHPEPALENNYPGHDAAELVAQIHRVDTCRTQEDTLHGTTPTVSSHHSSFFPPHVEPIVTAATPSPNMRDILLLNRIELARARTLRALVGPNHAACSGNCLYTTLQETGKDATPAEHTRPPTLSELIDIAKAKIHYELTTAEHLDVPDSSKLISTKQKEVKTKKTKKIKSTKSKCTSTLAYEKSLVITASILLLAVISLVFCLAGMSTARRGHFVGLWLGS
ncbi:hypothetical protein MBLNU13_g10576t1 [Cladosporium sp. NU13]